MLTTGTSDVNIKLIWKPHLIFFSSFFPAPLLDKRSYLVKRFCWTNFFRVSTSFPPLVPASPLFPRWKTRWFTCGFISQHIIVFYSSYHTFSCLILSVSLFTPDASLFFFSSPKLWPSLIFFPPHVLFCRCFTVCVCGNQNILRQSGFSPCT